MDSHPLLPSNLLHCRNSKLFEEAYFAFKAGRAEADPSLTWYQDEIKFFDTYVIPLATKMKECELFDASCEDGIRYATSNREQWVTSGEEEVASMVESCDEIGHILRRTGLVHGVQVFFHKVKYFIRNGLWQVDS